MGVRTDRGEGAVTGSSCGGDIGSGVFPDGGGELRGIGSSRIGAGLFLVSVCAGVLAGWVPLEHQGWLWSGAVIVGVVALGMAADAQTRRAPAHT